jgi:hypothetical protein
MILEIGYLTPQRYTDEINILKRIQGGCTQIIAEISPADRSFFENEGFFVGGTVSPKTGPIRLIVKKNLRIDISEPLCTENELTIAESEFLKMLAARYPTPYAPCIGLSPDWRTIAREWYEGPYKRAMQEVGDRIARSGGESQLTMVGNFEGSPDGTDTWKI